jgi:hypothetical protein
LDQPLHYLFDCARREKITHHTNVVELAEKKPEQACRGRWQSIPAPRALLTPIDMPRGWRGMELIIR